MRKSAFRPNRARACAALWIFALLASAAPASAEEIVTVSGRKDATQSYLLMYKGSAQTKAVAVLFPGGEGLLKLRSEGGSVKFGSGKNFLVRTRGLFRDAEVAVAIIDSPSDQQRLGMDDGFRASRAHVEDIAAVVKDLRARFPRGKIFLIGTSRGTVSAAHLGRSLGDAVDGVILTSTVFYGDRYGSGLSGFDFGAIKAPLLLVHHAHDGCRPCPYNAAESLGRRFPLVTVRGGKPAQSDQCEALSAHGYFGKEAETVKAMKDWMLGQPFPKTVE
jgi:hypothetical protein